MPFPPAKIEVPAAADYFSAYFRLFPLFFPLILALIFLGSPSAFPATPTPHP